jgi:hypothetical protein
MIMKEFALGSRVRKRIAWRHQPKNLMSRIKQLCPTELATPKTVASSCQHGHCVFPFLETVVALYQSLAAAL